ncbi:helix-turn-helix transcriptional regulator [Streptococcus suis]|uniref:helix-turn-helix domain-containing protein n=1 Tax=Streptococcus TaxID=1301 RepID=UPI00041931DC|nr:MULTISPECIES: helix-turn-helix transcriptional regulator [Streptococcus]MBL1124787.1 helix-turn-helix transcriptional regulator [Streptococcus suis]MBY4962468.1 helix-turn-helix transcriptional regulator [Streptococcus suis]MBY4969149.1 helix-turn-helix transcriptional regulator [Streptococcus suis]MBY4980203.1 helix-turn-helix transcriptional regulator [Streptococcus suis]MBY4988774.1 helix-turn-helix transcriptional regulator [Streptococcus suis]
MIQVLSKEEMMNFFQTHSRYQIAQATGLSESTLANYVKGRTDVGGMSFDKVIKITEYYNSLHGKKYGYRDPKLK